ncbi:uncharacterized protein LOC122073810 isoform X2 [Macadamia integrifolia]|uniref:uncharacterized protein LOC122073810 isoform X2 n=1 Tax=Macadamia integrifolia TaxID=60698 RepID=UPI001C4ECE19|nr:uncharacterized protein LOC122073810 isoform X2 [Macadamia integrifolia]
MTHPILLLGLLIIAYFSGSQGENSFSQYWEEHIGLPLPPHWLAAKASPLSLHQIAVFMKLMEKNELACHLHSFFTGAVIGQIGFIILRCRPVFNCVLKLIDCLRNPRPPPPPAITAQRLIDAIEERIQA